MDQQHIVTEDIDRMMKGDLAIHDASGAKIGTVRDYSNEAGYLVVQTGLIAHKELYVPYSAIQSIDPREIFLSLYKEALVGDFSAPPPATIVVEGDTATTKVTSGYDGSPVEINRVNLAQVHRDLARGMTVLATGGTNIGTVEGIDPQVGYMVVKPHSLGKNRFFIPFAAITSIDRQFGEVFLAVSKDVLLKDHTSLPDGTVLRLDTAPVTGVDVIVTDQQTKS
jgi:hypothetical protein